MHISFLVDLRSHFSWVETQEWDRWFVCRYIVHFLSIDLVFPSSSVIFPTSNVQRSNASTPSPALVAGPLFDAGHPSAQTSHCGFHLHFHGKVSSPLVHYCGQEKRPGSQPDVGLSSGLASSFRFLTQNQLRPAGSPHLVPQCS